MINFLNLDLLIWIQKSRHWYSIRNSTMTSLCFFHRLRWWHIFSVWLFCWNHSTQNIWKSTNFSFFFGKITQNKEPMINAYARMNAAGQILKHSKQEPFISHYYFNEPVPNITTSEVETIKRCTFCCCSTQGTAPFFSLKEWSTLDSCVFFHISCSSYVVQVLNSDCIIKQCIFTEVNSSIYSCKVELPINSSTISHCEDNGVISTGKDTKLKYTNITERNQPISMYGLTNCSYCIWAHITRRDSESILFSIFKDDTQIQFTYSNCIMSEIESQCFSQKAINRIFYDSVFYKVSCVNLQGN